MSSQAQTLIEVAAPRPLGQPVARPDFLRAEGLRKRWGNRLVLDSVDLSVNAGDLVALVGANGAGKTTLLRIIAGLIHAERGTVLLDGMDVRSNRRDYHRRVGFVSAGQTGLYARLSVRDHLEYWSRIAFIPRAHRKPAIEHALESFELSELCDRRAERLSMGQRQRVRLAMSFLHGPSLLLLDEPRTSLDAAGVTLLGRALESALAAGAAAIWCAPEAGDLCLEPACVYQLSDAELIRR